MKKKRSSPPAANGPAGGRRRSRDAGSTFESLDGTAIGIGMDTHATDDLSDRMYLSAACARERDERFRFLLKHLQAIELSLRAFRGHARWFVDAVAGLTDSAQLLGEDLKAMP